ncbi:hypothetical protein HYS31_06990 [Candidatus Woesearchaeota archaeon]|nr:hypothetical protein [Candidatus Woesearchaeota archaeon]
MNKISILLNLFKKIEIADEVYRETILDGLERKFDDSLILKGHFDKGQIEVIALAKKHLELAQKIQDISSIGPGEAQTIALAKQLEKKELIIDELLAREAAKSLGLNPIGSLRVLLLAYEKELLNEKEVKEITDKMIKYKFRISALTLIRFWELFDKIKK